mgnify:CR=1 FL=1
MSDPLDRVADLMVELRDENARLRAEVERLRDLVTSVPQLVRRAEKAEAQVARLREEIEIWRRTRAADVALHQRHRAALRAWVSARLNGAIRFPRGHFKTGEALLRETQAALAGEEAAPECGTCGGDGECRQHDDCSYADDPYTRTRFNLNGDCDLCYPRVKPCPDCKEADRE